MPSAYSITGAVLTLSIEESTAFYPTALIVLVSLAAAVFLGNLLQAGNVAQRFYLAVAILLGLTVALLAFLGMSLLILAPVILVDELGFRGVLRSAPAGVTSARRAWLPTAALFAAYGAPLYTPPTFLFRLAHGKILGALAMRLKNLPMFLVAPITVTVALVVLGATAVGRCSASGAARAVKNRSTSAI